MCPHRWSVEQEFENNRKSYTKPYVNVWLVSKLLNHSGWMKAETKNLNKKRKTSQAHTLTLDLKAIVLMLCTWIGKEEQKRAISKAWKFQLNRINLKENRDRLIVWCCCCCCWINRIETKRMGKQSVQERKRDRTKQTEQNFSWPCTAFSRRSTRRLTKHWHSHSHSR